MNWKRKAPILLGLVAIAALIAYAWLLLYFTLGEDLIIDLSANQTSFRITNKEYATVQARLDSRGQLFCDTLCDFELYDSSGRLTHQENFTTGSNIEMKREMILRPKEIGTGQVIYSLRSTCHNRKSLICPSAGVEQRDTVLLTVNYDLPSDVSIVKNELRSSLPRYLEHLAKIDSSLQAANSLLSGSKVHAGQAVADLATLEEDFAKKNLEVKEIVNEYSKEEYEAASDKLSKLDEEDFLEDIEDCNALKEEILSLPKRHNSLKDRIEASRISYERIFSEYSYLAADPYAAPSISERSRMLNSTIDAYAQDTYQRYPDLERMVENIENISSFDAELQQRSQAIIFIGSAIMQDKLDNECANNITTSCMNVSYHNITALCKDMNESNPLAQQAIQKIIKKKSSQENTTQSQNESINAEMSAAEQFAQTYCEERAIHINNATLIPVEEFVWKNITSTIEISLPENLAQCCVFGECKDCCMSEICSNDPSTYPVVFVHGHSFNGMSTPEYSLGGYFSGMQRSLENDGYIDAGIVTPSTDINDVSEGEWGLSGRPVTARVTYYYNFYRSGDEYILVSQKSENIETYAIRLNEMVNIIKHHTGKKKVNIVAHSMGGLVVRRYIQLFGEDSVDKVILIGTPNNGTTGRVSGLCPIFGESKECSDMASGSIFLQKLNDPSNKPKKIKMTTIAGSGCEVSDNDGDGIVAIQSVALPYATNYIINGTCTDLLGSDLHSELLNIGKHPQTYSIVKESLSER